MKEKQKIRVKGQLRTYMQWPAILGILLMGMNVWIYKMDRKAGLVMSAFVLLYIVMVVILYVYTRTMLMKELVEFATQYGIVQNTLLKELAVPYAILLDDGKVIWMNNQFLKILGGKVKGDAYLSKYLPELNRSIFPQEENDIVHMDVYYDERQYQAELRKVSVEGFSETERLMEMPEEKECFIAVYLQDVTELNQYIKANEEQRLVAGLIYIDNYDEIIDSVEEVRQSLLVALVDRKINQYIAKANGIVKKMETDKYFIAVQKQHFKQLEEDKFSLLEGVKTVNINQYIAKANGIVKKMETDKYFIAVQKQHFKQLEEDKFSLLEGVKTVNIGNKIPATISMGFGLSEESYAQSYNYARVAIDLSLARGGDQAVIKDSQGITYYGGKREQTSKNTRVKARVKAEALREFITIKDKIFVMGHKFADADSFGAAVGICRAAEALEKKAYIVIDEISASLKPLYLSYAENPEYGEKMFLKPQEVLKIADENSMVVVVDTNRPKMTECEELLSIARTIVVLDHHRQSSDNIENALLSYIEPYASSSCEMVAEILQYIVDDIEIPELEASSLYAGIMIDTNNFVNKTGVRTFEAAAFLRRCGANITQVRKMFRDDMASYQAKAEIISSVEVYQEKFAIARGSGKGRDYQQCGSISGEVCHCQRRKSGY